MCVLNLSLFHILNLKISPENVSIEVNAKILSDYNYFEQ